MSLVRYNKFPKVTDQILFDIYTPDINGCFNNDPAFFNSIKIFFISRNLFNKKNMLGNNESVDLRLERNYFIKSQDYCDNLSDPVYLKAKQEAEELLSSSKKTFETYYTEAVPVFCVGDSCMTNSCISVAPKVSRIIADLNNSTHGYNFSNTYVGANEKVEITFGISCTSVPINLTIQNTSGNGGVIKITTVISGSESNYTVNDGSTFNQTFSMDEGDEITITKNANGTTWSNGAIAGEIKVGSCSSSDCVSGWYQPVWTRGGDNTYSAITKVTDDSEFPYGHFRIIWTPNSIREGDYYICYTYTPNSGGSSLSNFINFYVAASIQNEIATPEHATKSGKYEALLDAYTPEMYKLNYANQDQSVETISNLNSCVGKAFTNVEDQAVRIIDLMNANATPEPLLPLLSRFFGVKLRSNDINRWRGQIITAVPQFKRKGTLGGLRQALHQAGIKINNYYQYWQIGNEHAWTEGFFFTGSYSFELQKISLNIATDSIAGVNIFELQVNSKTSSGYSGYVSKSLSLISIDTADGISTLTWDSSAETLEIGSYIKIVYQTKSFRNTDDYNLYLYWKEYLILQDYRNELDVEYPPKNFNIRLITEDDSLFKLFIPVGNPFHAPVIFGKTRTVFPYSENIYNMDEYNGSLRDSNDPKDMDKSYVDECSGYISSHFGLSVEIENLSSFRETECREIIADYTPYHAVLRTLTITNVIEEYCLPPIEQIESLVMVDRTDFFIAGAAQNVFTRDILTLPSNYDPITRTPQPIPNYNIMRDALTDYVGIKSTGTTKFYNDYLQVIVSANTAQKKSSVVSNNFDSLAISKLSSNPTVMKILSPSPYAGLYNVTNSFKNGFNVLAGQISEPVTFSNFSFVLSNSICSGTFTISDASFYMLTDDTVDFELYNIISQFDVDQGFATNTWKITLSSGTYNIMKINNKTIYLNNDGTLSTSASSNVSYSLLNASSVVVKSSTVGKYSVEKIGKVLATLPLCQNVDFDELIKTTLSPDLYFDDGVSQYKFYGMVDNPPANNAGIYVSGITAPYAGTSQSGTIYNRLLDETVGRFKFAGMKIERQAGMPEFVKAEDRITRDQYIPENFIVTLNFGGVDYDYFLDLEDSEYPTTGTYLHLKGKFYSTGVTNFTSINYTMKEYAPKSQVNISASIANGFDYKISDYDVIFSSIGVKTKQDVANNTASGPWKVKINNIYYDVLKLLDNELYIEFRNTLPTEKQYNIKYELYDNNLIYKGESSTGIYQFVKFPSYVYYIDRSGQDVLGDDYGSSSFPFYLDMKSMAKKDSNDVGPTSTVVADDTVSYTIKYKDGGEEKRDIK